MTYDDLIFGFQSKTINSAYFKQFIYGYDDRMNTDMTKDISENPASYPIVLIPPQSSMVDKDNVEKFQPFSISGHKRPKQDKSVSISISSNEVTFSTSIFVSGDRVIIKDSRTNYEIPLILSVADGTATATSYISLSDGVIVSKVEEDHSAIQADIEKELKSIVDAVRVGFTDKTGATTKPQAVGRGLKTIRMDQYGTRGYVRVVLEFDVNIKNCSL